MPLTSLRRFHTLGERESLEPRVPRHEGDDGVPEPSVKELVGHTWGNCGLLSVQEVLVTLTQGLAHIRRVSAPSHVREGRECVQTPNFRQVKAQGNTVREAIDAGRLAPVVLLHAVPLEPPLVARRGHEMHGSAYCI